MTDAQTKLEQGKGWLKEKVGELIDDEDLRREGEAQQAKAERAEEAEMLEDLAEERRQKAAGHKGEEHARRNERQGE